MTNLILRKEYFGGILFSAQDATYLELDPEAFSLVKYYFEKSSFRDLRSFLSFRKPQHRFLMDLKDSYLPSGSWNYRYIDNSINDFLSAPTLVDLQLTNQCFMDCPHCYATSNPAGAHADFEILRRVIADCSKMGVFQIAIGGGEPLLHPHIREVLRLISSYGIVPNITTTGQNLNDQNVLALKETCGAVALSLEATGEKYTSRRKAGWSFFETSLNKLQEAKIPTVFQVTVSQENLDSIPDIVNFALKQKNLYGVIFLAYKPVGRGLLFNHSLSVVEPLKLYPILRDAFLALSGHTRVGYDCCLTPGIVGIEQDFGLKELNLLEGCSATRSSLGISNNFEVVPCTFLPEKKLGNLATQSLQEIWNNSHTERFRNQLLGQADRKPICNTCLQKKSCLGGCPVWDLVNCHRDYLRQNHDSAIESSSTIEMP